MPNTMEGTRCKRRGLHLFQENIIPRGKSLVTEAYGISVVTKGFLKDIYDNNRISGKSVRDF